MALIASPISTSRSLADRLGAGEVSAVVTFAGWVLVIGAFFISLAVARPEPGAEAAS